MIGTLLKNQGKTDVLKKSVRSKAKNGEFNIARGDRTHKAKRGCPLVHVRNQNSGTCEMKLSVLCCTPFVLNYLLCTILFVSDCVECCTVLCAARLCWL